MPRQDPAVPHPLSPAQQRLWFMEKLNPNIPVYNEAEAVLMTGELNVDALERAMNVIVDRREVLRSTIRIINEVPHAVPHESWPLRFKRIDISTLPAAERQAALERLLIDEPGRRLSAELRRFSSYLRIDPARQGCPFREDDSAGNSAED